LTPLLSICIPTYKRTDLLAEMLGVLLPEAERLSVEVCVSDNCTPGGEKRAMLDDFASRYLCLKVCYQSENTGLESNMRTAIGMAAGQFIYPLGDDDYLPEGSLRAILGFLEKTDIHLFILDGWNAGSNLNPISKHLPASLCGKVFSTPTEAFSELWDRMPFGSFICARGAFDLESWTKYEGTSHAYSGIVWDFLDKQSRQSGRCLVLCSPLPVVYLRDAGKSWKSDSARIFFVEIPAWFLALPPAYKTVASTAMSKYLGKRCRLHNLLDLRGSGLISDAQLPDLNQSLTSWGRVKLGCVARLPIWLAKTFNWPFILFRSLRQVH
jgi:glycosyltransferase involved in cell wall biosynthesis